MQGDEEENSFDRFTKMFSENPEAVRESPGYALILTHFAIPFMAKLATTARTGASQDSRNHAEIVINKMANTHYIEDPYLMVFIYMHCQEEEDEVEEEDVILVRPSPLYISVADTVPIPLTRKLLSIAGNEALDLGYRNCAATLVRDMAEHPSRLHAAYPTVDRETALPDLRRTAVLLMLYEDDQRSQMQSAGYLLTKKLISLKLRHDDEWDEFLELLQFGFDMNNHVCDLILDLFCDARLHESFAAFLEPTLRENSIAFLAFMRAILLAHDNPDLDFYDHDRGFTILPYILHIFNHRDHRNSLMEAAIMSPLFDYDHNHFYLMSEAAISLKLCIERGPAFRFSLAMINKMKAIIRRLRDSPDNEDRRAVEELDMTLQNSVEWNGGAEVMQNGG